MKKPTNARRSTNSFILISAAVLCAVWFGSEYIERQLKNLKIRELRQFQSQPFDEQSESFVQGWASGSKSREKAGAESADLDNVFLKKEEPKAEVALPAVLKPVQETIEAQLEQQVHLEAVMDNGAVINGRFVGVGKPVSDVASAVGPAAAETSILESVTRQGVWVKAGSKRIQIRLRNLNGGRG